MSDTLLELEGLRTDIGQYHILHGVDLKVPRGQVTMLLGRNGAGKTTTLRSVMGLWRPHAGRVVLDGRDIAGLPPAAIARAGVAIVPEDMGIFANLTVEENMVLAAVSGPMDRARLDWLLTAFPPLRTFWKMPAGNLSGGQKQMLSCARAMIEPRALYLIDEPSKGLAPAIVATLARALRDLKAAGATILMVEQNFALARALGDRAAVMDDGRIVWTGAMADLAGDKTLQERLMGLSMEHA
jgi:branched-chain amino acid transport system ATP-binding protein